MVSVRELFYLLHLTLDDAFIVKDVSCTVMCFNWSVAATWLYFMHAVHCRTRALSQIPAVSKPV